MLGLYASYCSSNIPVRAIYVFIFDIKYCSHVVDVERKHIGKNRIPGIVLDSISAQSINK